MLSASGASRWLICTPSARLEEQFEETESAFADEGTLAHTLCELMLRYRLKWISSKVFHMGLLEVQAEELYDQTMMDWANTYADYVMDKYRSASKGARIYLEQKLILEEYVPEGYGTVDVAIVGDDLMEVIDFKYGKGVYVEAKENRQMMLYAIGAYREFDYLYDIKDVRMTIYQPRIDNISSYDMPIKDLMLWANETLRPTARTAFQGLGEYIPGDHCRFCRARAVCQAHAKYQLQVAAREFTLTTITDEQVAKVLLKADSMKKWITSVEQHALHLAVNHGKQWPGLKVVAGRSNRRYADEKKVLDTLVEAGYKSEQVVNKKLPGITDLSKIITTLDFQKCVEPHLIKPPGAPTLVPISDKRPAWNSAEAARLDFHQES